MADINMLKIKARKVTASNEVLVDSLYSEYPAEETAAIVTDLLASPEFVETLTEEPQCLEVTLTPEDELEVNVDYAECGISEDDNPFVQITYKVVEIRNNLQMIHWAAKGLQFDDLHQYAENKIWTLNDCIDTYGELAMEFSNVVPELNSHQYNSIDISEGFDVQSGFQTIQVMFAELIGMLEMYYPCATHDVQSVMDEHIRSLKKETDYLLKRRLTQ